jgi:hypothetical protein
MFSRMGSSAKHSTTAFVEIVCESGIGFKELRMWSSGGLLWRRQWTASFIKEDNFLICWVWTSRKNPAPWICKDTSRGMLILNDKSKRMRRVAVVACVKKLRGFTEETLYYDSRLWQKIERRASIVPSRMLTATFGKFYEELARCSIVDWGTMLQAGRSRIRFPLRSLDFLVDLILPAALWPWVRLSL